MSSPSHGSGAAGACRAPAGVPVEFAAVLRGLAQEIRQPLSSIEAIAYYLELALPRNQGKSREHLKKLRREVRQIDWLLSDAVHFLQAEPLHPQLLDLSEVVSRDLSEWNSSDDAEMCLKLERDLPPVHLDVEQIQHLIRSLSGFFRRIARPGSQIHLFTAAAGQEVALDVGASQADYRQEELEPLFESPGGSLPPGPSLSLATVRQIAAAHGARLEVQPGPGGELRVKIFFPSAT